METMKTPDPGLTGPDRSPSLYSYSSEQTNRIKQGESIRTRETMKDNQIKEISVIMKPLFVFMKLFCLYPSYGKNNYSILVYYGFLIYSIITITVNWFNVGRYFWAYPGGDVFGPSLFLKIVNHVMYFQIALGSTVFCISSCKIPSLVKLWQTIRCDHDTDGVLSHKLQITIRVTMCVLTLFLFTPILMCVQNDTNLFMIKLLALPFQFNMTSFPVQIGIQIGSAIALLLYMGQWTGAIAFLVVACLRIADDFKKIEVNMKKDLESCSIRQLLNQFDLELYRQRHLQLCKLVEILDNIISVYVLGAFITNIPVVCFSIYILMSQPFMIYQGSINVLIVTLSMFVFLMIITASGSILSNQVK